SLRLDNVEFRDGIAEDLSSLDDDSFDIAISMHGAPFPWDKDHRFIRGCERVVRAGGHLVVVGTTPDWRPLHARAGGRPFVNADQRWIDSELRERGFEVHDSVVDMDYGTQQEALETFGFIYG